MTERPLDNAGLNPAERVDQVKADTPQVMLLAGLVVLVLAAVAATYWPVLTARATLFDDTQYLLENPLVQQPGWRSVGRFMGEVLNPSTVQGYYQPLSMISLLLDYAIGGRPDNLLPFHRTALCLHLLNTALVVVILYQLFRQPWVAALLGLLFGLHPLTVEPVAWVSERKTLLAACFSFLCLVLYLRYTRRCGWGCYLAVAGTYVAALMSKPTSTPLPLVLLLVDYWPLRRLSLRTVLEKVPLFVIGGIAAIITVVSQGRAATVTMPGQYEPLRIPLTLCHNIVFYLRKIVWPTNLSAYYVFPESMTLSHPMVLAGVIGTFAILLVLVVSARWTRAFWVGGAIFFVAILPTMGVIGFTQMIAADKYTYLPSIGLLMVLAHFSARLWGTPPSAWPSTNRHAGLLVVVAVLATAGALATRGYLAQWRDKESLFRHMLALDPKRPALHNGLGRALLDRNEVNQAIQHFRLAVRFDRRGVVSRNNLAQALRLEGKTDEAAELLELALRIEPNSPAVRFNLACIMVERGQFEQAVGHYTAVLRAKPWLAPAHNNLGVALVKLGKLDQAIEHYTEAVRLDPGFGLAYRNLGAALSHQGKIDRAIDAYRQMARLQPRDADAHFRLGQLLARLGKTAEAIAEYRKALEINPRHAGAQKALARPGKTRSR